MKPKTSAAPESQPTGEGGGGRPNKKAKAKKPPTKKATALCPAELKDFHQRDENDGNICWAFNSKSPMQKGRAQVRQLPSHWPWTCIMQVPSEEECMTS